MSDPKTLNFDQLVSVTRDPTDQSFSLTASQGETRTQLKFPASQAPGLVIAAIATLPPPQIAENKQVTTSVFEVDGMAAGRDGLGRLALSLSVQGQSITFMIPAEHEVPLRAVVAEAPPVDNAKPN